MASFEVVVRPVVFPAIRPAPAQPLPPADDPEKGFAVIHGQGGKQIDLATSYSSSTSSSQSEEIRRRVDRARVSQMDENKNVNRNNFVDIDVANKLWVEGGMNPSVNSTAPGYGSPGVGSGTPEVGSSFTREQLVMYFKKVQEEKNVEIKKRNLIIENPR